MTERLTEDEILKVLERDGYAVVPGAVSPSTVAQLRGDLETAIATETSYHRGTDYVDYGMVLVCCTHARSFVDILAERSVMGVIERILGEGSIIYAYTSSSMPPHTSNYSQRIHVDCPRLIRNAWIDAPDAAPADVSCLSEIAPVDLGN